MPEALAAVKRALGPDAVILGTRTLPAEGLAGLTRKNRVEVTAAPPGAAAPAPRLKSSAPPPAARQPQGSTPVPVASTAPPPTAASPALPEHLCRYYVQLVQNDVAEELAERLVRQAGAQVSESGARNDKLVQAALCEFIARMLPDAPGLQTTPGTLRRVALVGPSGSGKTTTLAKLAAHLQLRAQQRVALLTLDMHRLDGHAQLQRYAEAIGVPLHNAQTIAEVRALIRQLDQTDVLLIDTPGIGTREQARFARLATLLRATRPDEVHLVLPASLDARVQVRQARGFLPLGVTRLVLTRLDDVVGCGVILNAIERLNLRVSFVTNGQNVPQDLQEACGRRFAELICGPSSALGECAVVR